MAEILLSDLAIPHVYIGQEINQDNVNASFVERKTTRYHFYLNNIAMISYCITLHAKLWS